MLSKASLVDSAQPSKKFSEFEDRSIEIVQEETENKKGDP